MTIIWRYVQDLLASLLPASSGFDATTIGYFKTALGWLDSMNSIFPVATFFAVLQAVVAFELVVLAFHFGRFLLNLFRGSGA